MFSYFRLLRLEMQSLISDLFDVSQASSLLITCMIKVLVDLKLYMYVMLTASFDYCNFFCCSNVFAEGPGNSLEKS